MKMGMLDLDIMKRYIRMCEDGWLQGWHERNGGNLTYRLKKEEVEEMKPFFDPEAKNTIKPFSGGMIQTL